MKKLHRAKWLRWRKMDINYWEMNIQLQALPSDMGIAYIMV